MSMAKRCAHCGQFLSKTDYLLDDDAFDEELAYECGYTSDEVDAGMTDLDSDLSRFRYVTIVWECSNCSVWYQFTDSSRFYWNPDTGLYDAPPPRSPREQAEYERQQQEAAGQMRLF